MNRPKILGAALLFLLTGLLGCFIFFRQFIQSGGEWISGDMADGRLILAIHEHWFRFLQGKEGWFDLGFYYPHRNALGYSDTFLLTGAGHAFLRSSGMDMFLSFQLVQVCMSLAGFTGMFAWLFRFRKTGYFLALFGSFLFLIASPVFLSTRNSHIQLQAVWIMPWFFILLEMAWLDLNRRPASLRFSFTAFCGLYGLVTYSTFYMAWFLLLFMVLWFGSALVICGWRQVWAVLRLGRDNWRHLVPGVVVAGAFLGLFLKTYLPTRLEHGGRSLKLAIESLPEPWDFINHSDSNLLWGKINSFLHPYPGHYRWELELGPTLVFAAVVIGFAVYLMRLHRRGPGAQRTFQTITALAVLASFAILIRLWLLSLWAVPYFLVPGASGIRATLRYTVFLVVPSIYLLVLGLQHIRLRISGPLGCAVVFLVGGLVLLEQGQLVQNTNINRHDMLATLKRLPDPPADAVSFMGTGTCQWDFEQAIIQNSSIMYAQHWNFPTVGGRSGFFPGNWGLLDPGLPQVHARLVDWCQSQQITGAVYLFDTQKLEWLKAVRRPESMDDLGGIDVTELTPEFFRQIAVEGWSQPEPWGVWSDGYRSTLAVPVTPHAAGLELEMVMMAYVNEAHPQQRLEVLYGGKLLCSHLFTVGAGDFAITVRLEEPGPGMPVRLEFITADAASPESLGLHADARNLGIGLKRLVIRPL